MKIIIDNINIPIEKDSPNSFKEYIAAKLEISSNEVGSIKIVRKSLDARKRSQLYYNYSFTTNIPDNIDLGNKYKLFQEETKTPYPIIKKFKDAPIVVGFGPSGIFASLTLIKHGIKPIILERGKSISDREKDLSSFMHNRKLDLESNIQFGEGGAGAYSDGKLTSRSKERPHVRSIMETFIRFGAPEKILYLNKPHLGTDKLLNIIPAIREYLISKGAQILFSSKVTDLIIADSQIKGVIVNSSDKYYSNNVLLAPGHSARDTYTMLRDKDIALEQKAFAIGTRVEHPCSLINEMQYGKKYQDHTALGAADYMFTFNDKTSSRGTFSFCMCPGGEVINSSSEENMLLVNGMSCSARSSQFSNSALVVTVNPNDFPSRSPLAGIDLQKTIEANAYTAGGSDWGCPAQNLMDFLQEKTSSKIGANSYKMGTRSFPLKELFPAFIPDQIKRAVKDWNKRFPLFGSDKAVLMGAETRTSSPVRILRDNVSRESTSIKGLYPSGEGSGYSGGIISSAIDGIKSAEKILGIN